MKNKIYRLYLKFLYLGYSCFCFIFRPRVRGAYVLVTSDDKILIIKNSYKKGWTLPCGMIDRHEAEVDGAKRELFEEVGISCDTEDLIFLREYLSTSGFKYDHQFFYLLKCETAPEVNLDMREVINYKWVSIEELYHYSTPDSVKEMVSEFKDFIFNKTV